MCHRQHILTKYSLQLGILDFWAWAEQGRMCYNILLPILFSCWSQAGTMRMRVEPLKMSTKVRCSFQKFGLFTFSLLKMPKGPFSEYCENCHEIVLTPLSTTLRGHIMLSAEERSLTVLFLIVIYLLLLSQQTIFGV